MNTIIGEIGKSQKFIDLSKQIENIQSPISISGLTNVGMSQIISAINSYNKKTILLVTYNEIQAKNIVDNLRAFQDDKVVLFPKKEIVTYDYIAESKDLPYQRIETLNKIQENKNLIIVTTIEALMQKLPAKETLYKDILEFKIGDICNLEDIKRKLVNLGYSRYDLIDGRGQFSIRGGIIDISLDEKIGVRIELWGDEVDSIRNFSISSQRSISTLEKIKIYPSHEYVLEDSIENICKKIEKKVVEENQQEIIEQDIEVIKAGNYISKIDKYFDEFYNNQETLIDYIKSDSIIALDEIKKIEQREVNILQDIENLSKNLIEKEKILPEALQLISELNIDIIENKYKLIYLEKQDSVTNKQAERYHFEYREINYFKSEIENLFEDINKWNKEQKSIYVMVDSKEKAKKLQDLFEKENILSKIEEKLDKTIIVKSKESIITISIGKITEGFENFEINQVVISADDLIDGGKKKKTFSSQAFKDGEKVVFADLKAGDYIVHKNYGIGIFIGVNTITADGTTKDYIKLKYKNDAVLYIPTNKLDTIRKYIGGDSINPPINSLGSKEWIKTKEKVKNNLRAVAKELIELYAKRENSKGYAFGPDSPWQNQFEERFPYQETDDQLRCIEEVKKDMEMQRPMDRLLCGDVGYGKTEVAIRAAFKAVMDHKQVAYLVPTTI